MKPISNIGKNYPKRGFTLIELLIVLVIIGIIALVGLSPWTQARQQAIISTMQQDLRNLIVAEESYFFQNQHYTNILEDLNYHTSAGNVVAVVHATETGLNANISNPNSGIEVFCEIFMGDAIPSLGVATKPNEIACGIPQAM